MSTHDPSTQSYDPVGPGNDPTWPDTGAAPPLGQFAGFDMYAEAGRDGPFVLVRARQPRLNRAVVLKMPPRDSADPALAEALREEAAAAARLENPGVVRVLETGEQDGVPFLALAHVEGETLAERLRQGPVPERVAADWARQIAETLFFAHQQGVAHRNLQPEYVHLGRDGQLRLSGFGTADRPGLPTGLVPPERTRGAAPAAAFRTDVYGVGGLLYAMLTGRLPHEADSPKELAVKVRMYDPVPPRRRNRRVSADLQAVCLKCLRREAGRRYGGELPMKPLIADLRRFLGRRPVKARPGVSGRGVWLWGRRNLRPVVVAAVILLGVAVPAAWDRWRAEAAWAVLARRDAAPEEHAAAGRYFERIAEHRPADAEAVTAVALAHFRAGRPEEAEKLLSFSAGYLGVSAPGNLQVRHTRRDPSWLGEQYAVWALASLHAGRFSAAKAAVSPAGLGLPAPTELSRALGQELSDAMRDPDLIARSVRAGDRDAIRQAAAALRPSPELVRALVLEAVSYTDPEDDLRRLLNQNRSRRDDTRYPAEARAALEKFGPDWPRSEGARQALPALVVQLAARREEPRAAAGRYLPAIDPDWRRSPEARRAITPLVLRLAIPSADSIGRPTEPRPVLAQIDPNWPRSPEAATAAPVLAGVFRVAMGEGVAGRTDGEDAFGLWWAVDTLAELGPNAAGAAPGLREVLDGPSAGARAPALAALAAIEPRWADTDWGRRAFADLLAQIADGEGNARTAAARALARITPPDRPAAVRALLFALPDEQAETTLRTLQPDWPTSGAAKSAVPALALRLREGTPTQRIHAAYTLARLGPAASGAVPALVEALTDTAAASANSIPPAERDWISAAHEPAVNVTALKALGEIDPDWHRAPAARAAVPRLIDWIAASDSGPGARLPGGEEVQAALGRIDPDWRKSEAMRRAVERLADQVTSAEAAERRRAADGVRRVGPAGVALLGPAADELTGRLIERLADDDAKVRESATAALEQLAPDWTGHPAGRRAAPYLRRQLNAADDNVRGAALNALARVRPPVTEAVPRLIELCTDTDTMVSSRAREALYTIQPDWVTSDAARQAVPWLAGRLSVANEHARWAAAEMLERIGPLAEPALDAVAAQLGSRNQSDADMAVRVLRAIGPPAVRVADALGRANSREAVALLKDFGPAAAAGVPGLVERLGAGRSEIPSVVEALDKIQPDWRHSAAVKEALPRWAERMHSNKQGDRTNFMAAVEAVGPLGDLAPAAARAIPSLQGVLRLWPQQQPGRSQALQRNSEEATAAARTLALMGPAAADTLPDLARRLSIPLHTETLGSDQEKEYEAVWEALPKIDPQWMWTPTADEVREAWVKWTQRTEGPRLKVEQELGARFLKRLEAARKAVPRP